MALFGCVGAGDPRRRRWRCAGGIFTIIPVPLGLIMAGSAFLYATWGRSAQGSTGGDTEAAPSTNRPLPHSPQRYSGHVPTSPERLADARRAEQ